VLVALCVVGGAGFMLQGRSITDAAVANVDPQMREMLVEQGYKESARPLQLGVGLAVVGGIIAAAGEAKRRAARS
jgi:hypothetical protein